MGVFFDPGTFTGGGTIIARSPEAAAPPLPDGFTPEDLNDWIKDARDAIRGGLPTKQLVLFEEV